MADTSTFERVCDIIRDNAGADDVELKPETTMSELGLDSLATVGEFVELVEAQLEK